MEDKGDTNDSAADELLRNQDGVDSHGENATADGQQKQVEEESFQGLGPARFAFYTIKLRGYHRFLVPWMNDGAGGGKMTWSTKQLLDPTQTHKNYSFKAAFAIIFTLKPITDALGQGRQGAS
jgi:hypothetical protein